MAGEAVLSIVLEGLLSKLSSPILDEFGLLWGVKKEKQKLQSNLSRIKALLQDAESRRIDLMADKDCLRKLKDVAYDAEDLFDEFLVEALRRKVENQDGMGRKVGNFFSPANPIAFRFKIAHKMKELRERFDDLAKENNNFKLPEGVARSQPRISTTRETASNVPDSGVRGRDYEKENLIDSLINSGNEELLSAGNEEVLSVIPIVGMGGLGKTTLAQFVYDDERVVTHFNLNMWVYVSEDFDVGRILAKILESATKSTPTDGSSKDLLITRVKENLSGKRYLLVLDDVWNEVYEKWAELRTVLKCGAIGSKILVTTRSDTVARIMHALPRPRLDTLSAAESWTLFEKVAHPPTDFVPIGKEIVRKCGGVPLAITTLGGMLVDKTGEREWQSVRDSELWTRTDNEGGILSILRLSYDYLTSSLKQCFAYCAVIPKGRRFDRDELILQWIAQGFIHSHDDENELLEEEGEKYFNALLRRSLFQVDVETRIYSYKMHDLIHDLLRSVAGKECFVVEASMMKDLTPHVASCNDETHHLALWNDYKAREPKNLDALKKCKKLRSMMTSGLGPIDINVCLSFRCLRVLNLSSRSIHFLPNSIDKLRHLRYFDISYTKIKELPETICNLHNLQTLRVLGIPLKKWPKNMKRMISLRHIEFDEGDDFPLPKGMGKLTSLRTLPELIIAKESGPRIEELRDLNLLWGNIHIGGLENIGSVECAGEADLKAKKHLNSLRLSWSGNETEAAEGNAKEVIEVLEPHSDLKDLSVENYTGLGFPSWMMKKLTNLKKISLSSCKRCEQLPPLGQLDFLESLEIDTADAVKHIVEFDGSHNYNDFFPSLKDLHLRNMPNLERWPSPQDDGDGDEQGRERHNQVIFKCLRTLKIHDCPKLAQPPRLLLQSLESLEIGGMGWDKIEIPTSQSLMKVELDNMFNLERWSLQEVDDDKDEQVTFRSLSTLRISKCPKLISLPQLLLPALEELKMEGVGSYKLEFSTSKSLKKVELTEMPNLERWSPQEADDDDQEVFHCLVDLVVQKCPKMVRLPHFLPSLEELVISESNEMLLASVANYTSLSKLSIDALPEVKHLPEELGPNHASLRKLRISNCPKLISLSNQLENLLALKELSVDCGCNDLVLSLPNGLQQQQQRPPPLNSLEVLEIYGLCEKQTSLPGDGIVLPSLKKLRINYCENIESLSADMLKNLTALSIRGCPKVWSSLVSLENLKSLERLWISGCPESVMIKLLESMENLTSLVDLSIEDCPDMRSLPKSVKTITSLTSLTIQDCPGMRSLPEWLGDLTLLEVLTINRCLGMMSLPEGLQRLENFESLSIIGCPVLERRVQRNKGQDWHKVAHVGYIYPDTEGEESSDQCPHLLLHSLKKLEKLLPLPSCCSSSPSSSSPPST